MTRSSSSCSTSQEQVQRTSSLLLSLAFTVCLVEQFPVHFMNVVHHLYYSHPLVFKFSFVSRSFLQFYVLFYPARRFLLFLYWILIISFLNFSLVLPCLSSSLHLGSTTFFSVWVGDIKKSNLSYYCTKVCVIILQYKNI